MVDQYPHRDTNDLSCRLTMTDHVASSNRIKLVTTGDVLRKVDWVVYYIVMTTE